MFKTKLHECKDDKTDLRDKVSELEFELRKINREKDFNIDERIKDGASMKETDINELKIESAEIKKENEMLNKAFDEIGFDVKDSKEMMSELIKALSNKADVKIIR